MKVTVKDLANGEVVFSRVLPNDKTMNRVMSALTTTTAGSRFETVIENRGHSLPYRNDDTLNVEDLIRHTEGIAVRKPATVPPAPAAA